MKNQRDEFSPQEIAQRRDATIKAMIAMPPKRHKDEPKRGPAKRVKAKGAK